MNPSSRGWIKKLLRAISQEKRLTIKTSKAFYLKLRQSGFIYGSNIHIAKENDTFKTIELTDEERCKVNLLLSFYNSHHNYNCDEKFIDSVIRFYTQINEYKSTIFGDLLGEKQDAYTLEKIIHKRVQIDTNLLTKNFNYFITNALLYVDILAYHHFLEAPETTKEYIKNLESTIESIVYDVLHTKERKTQYDDGLIKLLESSLRYQDHSLKKYDEIIAVKHKPLEALYVLDIACMATWSDQIIDTNERQFLEQLGRDFNLKKTETLDAIASVNHFFTAHKEHISLLSSKNVVKSFYDNSSKMVTKLISRNSKRLYKELKESKELVKLISQAAVRDLSEEEQKKINEQLLDIIKSIPSLAIFMLPGGALLLPLFIKFIPKLLPSAFDDNRIDDD
jgi:hypothetical protein